MYSHPTTLRRFTLASHDVADGGIFDTPQLSGLLGAGGQDISPHLRWRGAPTPTQSYVVTMFDEHGLGDSGFWHWIVVDIPPGITELRPDAGHPTGRGLPNCASQLPNDLRLRRYIGAGPPFDDRPHPYRISVHAVDVPRLDIPDDGTPARLLAQLYRHAIGRASITATCVGAELAYANRGSRITLEEEQ
jgi:Raf kinase inhibitor-like YbhB/YbcL family protein